MTSNELDRMLDAIARRQHGVFHRRQVVEAGFTRRMIEHRRSTGAWLSLAPCVYALASHPFTWLRQAKAAELGIRGSAVSHRAAAVIHGFDDYRPGGIDITVLKGRRNSSPLATVHRTNELTTVRRQLIAVTPVARTVADLAAVVGPWRLERTIDKALLDRMTSVPDLNAEIARAAAGHQAQISLFRDLVADRGDGYVPPESALEAELYGALESPLLPDYIRQAALPWWSPAPMRVDALIPEWRVIVEIDGRRWHTRVGDFERDRARDHLAQRHGYEVVRFTFRQVQGSGRYVVELLLELGAHRRLLAPTVNA